MGQLHSHDANYWNYSYSTQRLLGASQQGWVPKSGRVFSGVWTKNLPISLQCLNPLPLSPLKIYQNYWNKRNNNKNKIIKKSQQFLLREQIFHSEPISDKNFHWNFQVHFMLAKWQEEGGLIKESFNSYKLLNKSFCLFSLYLSLSL